MSAGDPGPLDPPASTPASTPASGSEPGGAASDPRAGRLELVVASANPDKVAEIAAVLGDAVVLVP